MTFCSDQSLGLQNVENRSALGSAASGHLVKAPLVRAGAATRALGDTENNANAGTIELVAQGSVPRVVRVRENRSRRRSATSRRTTTNPHCGNPQSASACEI